MFQEFINWLAGKEADASSGYQTLLVEMRHDTLWITITVCLNVAVILGFLFIIAHWRKAHKTIRPGPEKKALESMQNIFVLAGMTGYLFVILKMIWPAWRLYDVAMMVLVFYTWRYVTNANKFRIIYEKINRTDELEKKIEETETDLRLARDESKRKSAFLNAISHDLRTPLNNVELQTQLAKMNLLHYGDHKVAIEALEHVEKSVIAAGEILNNFLELGKLDWLPDRCVFNCFMMQDVVAGIRQNISPSEFITLDLPNENIQLYTDQNKLARILLNLISNGVKFTTHGTVKVVAKTSHADLIFEVSDTGCGMDAVVMKNIFNEFYQADNPQRDSKCGFGLGLCVVKRLVGFLEGNISVSSEVGVGSTFSVIIPNCVMSEMEFSNEFKQQSKNSVSC